MSICVITSPSFSWEWIENQLVVTKIFNQNSPIKVGDVITHIDKRGANDHFQEIYSRISAGSEGWLKYKAQTLGLMGNENSTILITVNGKEIELKRTDYSNAGLSERDIYKKINDSVFYMDITRIQMDTIRELLPQLNNSKSIICDLRGRPNLNHDFISHLLKENDTTLTWMRIPQVVYPDQANIAGYEMRNWLLKSKKPYLGDKQIIFITDGQAISYSESYLGFIEGYNLATIIGQPTAGTNGNINQFDLPGGLSVIWTGMKVVKHNGTQQHGTGIIPDIYVNKTIEGVKLNKDEFLERAIELTSDKNYNN